MHVLIFFETVRGPNLTFLNQNGINSKINKIYVTGKSMAGRYRWNSCQKVGKNSVNWNWIESQTCKIHHFRPFSYCIDQSGLGPFTAKSGRKHYNPPPLTVMWMNFDSPNFPSLCSLSAIISFQTCSNKCILYVLSFHKCIKIKYKTVNMYGVFLWLVQIQYENSL